MKISDVDDEKDKSGQEEEDEVVAGVTGRLLQGQNDRPLRRNIASRLTKKLSKESWTAVPLILLESYRSIGLSAEHAMFLIHLLSFKWDERKPFPGLRGIASTMKVDYSTVRRYAKHCRDCGLLVMEYRDGTTCLYDLDPLFVQLEELAEKKRLEKKSNPHKR